MLRVWVSRMLVLGVYLFSRLFYRFELTWVQPPSEHVWQNVRVFALLNHTSLLEPLFFGALPLSFLWDIAPRATLPGADITLERPIIGRFYRWLSPHTVSITRKRDESWAAFLNQISEQTLVGLAPEGRMMRANGLDKDGKPMSVRGGIADILVKMGSGKLMLAYSGGLHHVNVPGEGKLRLFKTLRLRLEVIDISEYLQQLGHFYDRPDPALRLKVARDLQARLKRYQP